MEYEADTIYEAKIDVGMSCRRIYFLFSRSKLRGKCVSIGEGIRTGPEWSVYSIGRATEVYHTCNEGTWMMHRQEGCNPTWTFRQWGVSYSHKATVSLAKGEPELRGKHYDVVIEDDIPSRSSSPEDVKKDTGWYQMEAQRMYTLKPKYMEEVKRDMGNKALFHVIFFNTKLEVIDFKDYITAASETDACMLAAQSFGKYDSNIHERVVTHILDYKVKE